MRYGRIATSTATPAVAKSAPRRGHQVFRRELHPLPDPTAKAFASYCIEFLAAEGIPYERNENKRAEGATARSGSRSMSASSHMAHSKDCDDEADRLVRIRNPQRGQVGGQRKLLRMNPQLGIRDTPQPQGHASGRLAED